MNTLPNTGFLRLTAIIGSTKAKPPIPAIIPVSRTTWLEGVKAKIYPEPVKIGTRAVAWPANEVQAIINARIAGKSDEEIKALVIELQAARRADQ